ncbi:MAG TPA: hypothetical protein PLE30_11400 [Candidatus Kapabacteria bacterium]|nr:hypothetical protein [Candidatus Kapabacteria bacterium]
MKKVFLVISVLFIGINLLAQNETGYRNLDSVWLKSNRSWLDSSTFIYQEKIPIIRSIPPLSTDMPIDILLGYIGLDSLSRFATSRNIDSTLKSWRSLNDTLKWALTYLYRLNDYNPMIFNQYLGETDIHLKRNNNGKFLANQRSLASKLSEKYRKLSNNPFKLAKYSMLLSDYILRVRITNLDSMINHNSSIKYMSFRAKAVILDTLKGNIIPQNNSQANSITSSYVSPGNFSFQYTSNNYGSLGLMNEYRLYNKVEPSFYIDNKFRMKIGQEAIIFIGLANQLIDNEHDYFDFELNPRCAFNALKIENGIVYDVNNVWSNQTEIPYTEWKELYLNYLQEILNRRF